MSEDTKGHRQRLRERFVAVGIDGFSDIEVVEFLIAHVLPRRDVKKLARKILAACGGSLLNLFEAPWDFIRKRTGLTPNASIFISFICQFARRCLLEKYGEPRRITEHKQIVEHLKTLFIGRHYEHFFMLFLNGSRKLIATECIAEGELTSVSPYLRNITESIIAHRASIVILAHNHPSDYSDPSQADIKTTQEIIRHLYSLDVSVADHVILAGNDLYSFQESGLLDYIKDKGDKEVYKAEWDRRKRRR